MKSNTEQLLSQIVYDNKHFLSQNESVADYLLRSGNVSEFMTDDEVILEKSQKEKVSEEIIALIKERYDDVYKSDIVFEQAIYEAISELDDEFTYEDADVLVEKGEAKRWQVQTASDVEHWCTDFRGEYPKPGEWGYGDSPIRGEFEFEGETYYIVAQ